MKLILFTAFFFLLLFSACRKDNSGSNDILGYLILIQVFDKNTSTISYPPSSNMDVVITFLDRNSFAGHTLRNSLSDGAYTQNGNEIIFKTFAMTKINEDQWGESFLTVLHACSLQSVSPCAPSVVTLQGNLMKIQTPLRYDITLKRI
jgi:hypothetical protein